MSDKELLANKLPRRIKAGVASVVTAQAQQDSYDVTLYAVRQWAKNGQPKVTNAGVKQIVNYQSLIDLLEGKESTNYANH